MADLREQVAQILVEVPEFQTIYEWSLVDDEVLPYITVGYFAGFVSFLLGHDRKDVGSLIQVPLEARPDVLRRALALIDHWADDPDDDVNSNFLGAGFIEALDNDGLDLFVTCAGPSARAALVRLEPEYMATTDGHRETERGPRD